MTDYAERREALVEFQLERRGISDPLVLDAMRTVPRELFVPEHLRSEAYGDWPLPIGAGQTISQPYIVAYMIAALELEGGEKALEIGSGSGYAAAVMAEIADVVYGIERIAMLAEQSGRNLAAAGCDNVTIRCADGTEGWPEEAPFDAILVSAGAPDVPQALKEQLAVGGRMVVPVGSAPDMQELVRVTRVEEDKWEEEPMTAVRFVPLIGRHGWDTGTGSR